MIRSFSFLPNFSRFLRMVLTTSSQSSLIQLRKNLGKVYPFGGPTRLEIPNGKEDWNSAWPNYDPPTFTTPKILASPSWSDKDISSSIPNWNAVDDGLNRISHCGPYVISDNLPLNPVGRTGISGRGNLGRWAVNHAVDIVVTRKSADSLEFIGIERQDTGEWAVPGGMVDRGEDPLAAMKREFLEEVFDLEKNPNAHEIVGNVFERGVEVYKGYVDDRRATDNSWIETIAYNFHINGKDPLWRAQLRAGSDAKNAKWIKLTRDIKLYANHAEFIKRTAMIHSITNV